MSTDVDPVEFETSVRRIGGSTFALIPPDVARDLGLAPGARVVVEVRRRGATGAELMKIFGKYRGKRARPFTAADRRAIWGDFGER